jgi:hypothetical protein
LFLKKQMEVIDSVRKSRVLCEANKLDWNHFISIQ